MYVEAYDDSDSFSFGLDGGGVFNLSHKNLLVFTFESLRYDGTVSIYNSGDYDSYFASLVTLTGTNTYSYFYTSNDDLEDYIYICFEFEPSQEFYGYIYNIQLFDLTLIFGSGNEPSTYSDFIALCPLDYYEYGIRPETD